VIHSLFGLCEIADHTIIDRYSSFLANGAISASDEVSGAGIAI